ncbi:MAG: beta-lactamase family protein [Rhodospirillales bacterium]|nr:beta-lactamase family protein [Rhodospirillales bacterium]
MASSFAAIDTALAAFAGEHRIPGIAAGIVQDGRLVHAATVGLADIEGGRKVGPDTAFRIASMTKNMTALAVLVLRDQGRLALDAPLATYVPQFARVPLPTRDSPALTLRHLLSHLGGQVYDDPWGDRVLGMTPAELDALIADGNLFARPPGVAFEYSNTGYGLIGRAITNVAGMPYQAYIARTILEPLGMTRTTFDAPAASRGDYAWPYRLDDGQWSRERIEPDGEVGAMGGLATTVPDYARYVAFLLGAWPARDDPETGPVRRSSVREMGLFHAPPFAPDPQKPAPPSAYGYGLNDTADPLLGRVLHHAGGLPGYGSHVLMMIDHGVGIMAFGNRTYAPMSSLTGRLAEVVRPTLPARPPPVASRAVVRAVEAIVTAYNAGRIELAKPVLAVNFLPDMPARFRDRELAELKQKLGEGRIEKIDGIHALGGRFTLFCEHGRLQGTVLLSPEPGAGIQRLTFMVES